MDIKVGEVIRGINSTWTVVSFTGEHRQNCLVEIDKVGYQNSVWLDTNTVISFKEDVLKNRLEK